MQSLDRLKTLSMEFGKMDEWDFTIEILVIQLQLKVDSIQP